MLRKQTIIKIFRDYLSTIRVYRIRTRYTEDCNGVLIAKHLLYQ